VWIGRHFGIPYNITGYPEKILTLIRSANEPFTCQVIHNNMLTEPFNIFTGVRQGYRLSPFLFLLKVDWVMSTTTSRHARGIQWTLLKHLEDLDLADDIALLSHRHKDMEEKTAILEQQGGEVGLRINHPKTKTMRINSTYTEKIDMRGVELEDVGQLTYLGSTVSKENSTHQDIISRIGKATAVFKTLRPIWTESATSTKTKIKIFNSNVKSVLLYACET